MKTAANKSGQQRHISVQWKLFLTLMCFTLLLLLTVWVVQIRLLGFFYEREKKAEMEALSAKIVAAIADPDMKEQLGDLSGESLSCIRVFRVLETECVEVGSAEVQPGCYIHRMSSAALRNLYQQTENEGGAHFERLKMEERSDEERPGILDADRGEPYHIIHTFFADCGEDRYFVVMDAALMPVTAVVNTLKIQFSWIGGTMLLLAAILTVVISRIISKPLRTITERAGQLAHGNYAADFYGKGFSEVEELAEALNFAATEIAKANALQRELIANVSHDLRTPLTMIRGYSEMMRDIPSENTSENMQVVIDETERLSALVNDLMDLSKLQAGTVKLEPMLFDLTELMRDELQRYEALMRPKGYRIEYRLPEEKAPILADRTMLLQVLYNLLNNAVNYTGTDLLVTVSEEIQGDRVRVSVRDTGEGISPEVISQIWDRYYRVDKVHKRAVMGTGLGLSIVKSVLERHNALYGVDSAVGVGSVFWFDFPLAKEPSDG